MARTHAPQHKSRHSHSSRRVIAEHPRYRPASDPCVDTRSTASVIGVMPVAPSLAGFWRRVRSTLIDVIVVATLQWSLRLALKQDVADLAALQLSLTIGYYVYFWSTTGQTVGNMLMGVKVVRSDGGTLAVGQAVVRYLALLLSIGMLFLGVLAVLWDPRKQGWHDKIADTLVLTA